MQLLTCAPRQPEKTEGLTAEKARLLAEDVQKTIAQARSHEDAARSKLADALELSRLVRSGGARTSAIPRPASARPARIWSDFEKMTLGH